jgi:hypothetical protein
MAKLTFNGVQISTWLEYILLKFNDTKYFEIDQKNENCILVKSKTNNTEICFIEYDEINQTITDCQYSNSDCRSWSGETCQIDYEVYGTFTQENLNAVDKTLETPIYHGWYSEDYYIGNSLYKAVSYTDKYKTKSILTYSSGGMGCLVFLLLPFSKMVEGLIKKGVFGRCEKITIEPIVKK